MTREELSYIIERVLIITALLAVLCGILGSNGWVRQEKSTFTEVNEQVREISD